MQQPAVIKDNNPESAWSTLANMVEGVTASNLQDLCRMSSCLNLTTVLMENNTLQSALDDLADDEELQFTIIGHTQRDGSTAVGKGREEHKVKEQIT